MNTRHCLHTLGACRLAVPGVSEASGSGKVMGKVTCADFCYLSSSGFGDPSRMPSKSRQVT